MPGCSDPDDLLAMIHLPPSVTTFNVGLAGSAKRADRAGQTTKWSVKGKRSGKTLRKEEPKKKILLEFVGSMLRPEV